MIQAAPALTNESRAVKFLCRRRLQTSLHTPYRRRSRNCTARSMFVKALRSSADLYWFAAAPPSFASLVKASPHLSFPAHGAPTPFPVNINAPFLADNSIVSELDFFPNKCFKPDGQAYSPHQIIQASYLLLIHFRQHMERAVITVRFEPTVSRLCWHGQP